MDFYIICGGNSNIYLSNYFLDVVDGELVIPRFVFDFDLNFAFKFFDYDYANKIANYFYRFYDLSLIVIKYKNKAVEVKNG